MILLFLSNSSVDCRFGQVLATICEELPPDGVLLVYLSASGSAMFRLVSKWAFHYWNNILTSFWHHIASGLAVPTTSSSETSTEDNLVREFQSHIVVSDSTSRTPFGSVTENDLPLSRSSKSDLLDSRKAGLQFSNRGTGGSMYLSIFFKHAAAIFSPLLK